MIYALSQIDKNDLDSFLQKININDLDNMPINRKDTNEFINYLKFKYKSEFINIHFEKKKGFHYFPIAFLIWFNKREWANIKNIVFYNDHIIIKRY